MNAGKGGIRGRGIKLSFHLFNNKQCKKRYKISNFFRSQGNELRNFLSVCNCTDFAFVSFLSRNCFRFLFCCRIQSVWFSFFQVEQNIHMRKAETLSLAELSQRQRERKMGRKQEVLKGAKTAEREYNYKRVDRKTCDEFFLQKKSFISFFARTHKGL